MDDRPGRAEKRAFEELIDTIMERRARLTPGSTSITTRRTSRSTARLVGRHATREEEVDGLLRRRLRRPVPRRPAGRPRLAGDYSIKKLEPLYGFERVISLRDAGSSIVNFELWLESEPKNQEILDLIAAYNRDDCVSTWQLRDWLEDRRA